MSGSDLLGQLDGLDEHQLRRLLVERLTKQKLGLYWEASAIARDQALNADVVLPRRVPELSCPLASGGERVEDCEVLLCGEVNAATVRQLAAWPGHSGAARLAIYTSRPDTLAEKLAARGVQANCYSLIDALLAGQGRGG